MHTFDHLLNWRLKAGSHPFPSTDGGTCINEAALVAAGFAYKPIRIAEQMPDCFSRPICSLAMLLNDLATDEDRQRLLPYVTRLACADTPKVEKARAAYIQKHMGEWLCFVGARRRSKIAVLSFDKGLEVLDGALAMGRQADPLGPDEVVTRMDVARSKVVKAPTPAPKRSLATTVKSWLARKETESTS